MIKKNLLSKTLLTKIKEKPYDRIGFSQVYLLEERWLLNELSKIKSVYQVKNIADFEGALKSKSDILVSAYLINRPVLSDILNRGSRECRIYYGDF